MHPRAGPRRGREPRPETRANAGASTQLPPAQSSSGSGSLRLRRISAALVVHQRKGGAQQRAHAANLSQKAVMLAPGAPSDRTCLVLRLLDDEIGFLTGL